MASTLFHKVKSLGIDKGSLPSDPLARIRELERRLDAVDRIIDETMASHLVPGVAIDRIAWAIEGEVWDDE